MKYSKSELRIIEMMKMSKSSVTTEEVANVFYGDRRRPRFWRQVVNGAMSDLRKKYNADSSNSDLHLERVTGLGRGVTGEYKFVEVRA